MEYYKPFPETNNEESVSDEFQDREFVYHMSQHVGEWHSGLQRCRIRKVPPELRLRLGRQSKNMYDPVTVSIGPYHHGKPELRRAEEFKHLCLNWCAGNMKSSYYTIILEKINVIRECYAEVSIVGKYEDSALAKMVLLDACFIINFMENTTKSTETNNMKEWYEGLGAAAIYAFTFRDLMLMENQIPFTVLTMLIKMKYHGEDHCDGEELIERFLRVGMILEKLQNHKNWKVPPMHLLEACRRVMLEKQITKPNQQVHKQPASRYRCPTLLITTKKKDQSTELRSQPLTPATIQILCVCRSVMDLKAKGIHFKPSSYSLADIKFNSGTFNGELQLPTRSVADQTLVILSNMIAYEVSPNVKKISPGILSYAIFMKSLIQSSEDVKELQEKGILINRLANLDQVVRVFNEIDTFGLTHIDAFINIRLKIERHCSNRLKTWMADLIHSRFNSPWTVIALLAATFLLCLTFLQTYFTISPVK